ncbi:MAG: DUF1109 family protein [Methyloprofundus sp.]|nr:DUF1109 family protein [Methyloprofundus sp.]
MKQQSRVDLIKDLSSHVAVVRPRTRLLLPSMLWFIGSWIYVVALSLYLGPLREGAVKSLVTSPQFAFESSMGLITGALFCVLAFRESIPSLRHQWLVYLSYLSAIVWVSCYVLGLTFPALEPSMLGKRAHCVLEAYLYSMPPLLIGYFLIYRRYPLNAFRAGMFMGVSAGMIPALFMQISCMYDPQHILTHHIGPATIAIAIGALLGLIFKKMK